MSGSTPTITFNRPVTLGGVATDVTIVKAAAPTVPVNLGPLVFVGGAGSLATQLATTATINLGGAAPLTAGDVITVKPGAATGVASPASTLSTLQGNVSAVVQSAGAAPTLSAATGVLTAQGGVLNTTPADVTKNVAIQANAALPAGCHRSHLRRQQRWYEQRCDDRHGTAQRSDGCNPADCEAQH